jgi:hypothetical protein
MYTMLFSRGIQQKGFVLAEGRRPFAYVNGYVEGPARDYPYQLALGEGSPLQVEPPQDAFVGERLVVLDERGRDSVLRKGFLVVGFKKKSPLIGKHAGSDFHQSFQACVYKLHNDQ